MNSIFIEPGTYSIFIQFIIGVLSMVMKTWLYHEKELNSIIRYQKEEEVEKICEAFKSIMDNNNLFDRPLRGGDGHQPDLLISHAKLSLNTALLFGQLKRKHLLINTLNSFLLITIFLSVVLFICSLLISEYLSIFVFISIISVLMQMITIFWLRRIWLSLNKFADL